MDEKEQKAKVEAYELERIERDIANKKREIADFKHQIEQVDLSKSFVKREIEIFKEVGKVMLENYGKIPDKKEHLWEETPEFWAIMKQKQALDNEIKFNQLNENLRKLDRQREVALDQIDGLEKSLKMSEAKLVEMKGE